MQTRIYTHLPTCVSDIVTNKINLNDVKIVCVDTTNLYFREFVATLLQFYWGENMHKAIIIARILWDRNKIIQPRLFKRDTRINVQNLETGNLWFESNSSFKEAQPKDLVNLLVDNNLIP